VRSGVQLNDIWFYIFDATPTFIAVMAFAIILPYDLPYGGMFKEIGGRRKCQQNDDADDNETVCESEITNVELEDGLKNP
jgi:hypothetical protein